MVIASGYLNSKTHHIDPLNEIKWFFIIPWMLIAIFGGMGPPPETERAWAALSSEQVVRYSILIVSGGLMARGFWRFKGYLSNTPGRRYGKAAAILFCVAIPLFCLNMAYWGYFLTYVFTTFPDVAPMAKPKWRSSLSNLFLVVRMAEVALFYLATAALAIALQKADQLTKASKNVYVVLALLGASLNLLPNSLKGPIAIASYLSYIPAFTMLMPYLITLNLALKSSNNKHWYTDANEQHASGPDLEEMD